MPTIAQFNTDVTNLLTDSAPLNSIAPSALAGLFVELSGIVAAISTVPGPAGTNGTNGSNGTNGLAGTPGNSAYQLWLTNGGVGTVSQYLASLVGATGPAGSGANGTNGTNGLSAYQVWVANGNVGTQAQYLTSLIGIQGPAGAATNGTNGTNGQSAYQVWNANGNVGTVTQFLTSLIGTNGTNGSAGTNGTNGSNGLSAYQVWTGNGNVGTVTQFLTSLIGTAGTNGSSGSNGTNGSNGLSAYQVWTGNGNVGTVTQFLTSLNGVSGTNGSNGTNGTAGLSAYQVWNANGNVGTQTQFLTSLIGTNGTNGINGFNFFTVSGVPAAGVGNNGDSAMDYTTGTTYVKGAGTWTSTGSLKGATGTGATGTNGTNGTNGAAGSNFLSTNGVPAAGVGNNGDSAMDYTTGILYLKTAGAWSSTGNNKGPQGIQGIIGNNGSAGPNGLNFSSGTGAPAGGNTGDSYLDRATGQLWTKATGTWVQNGNLTGPQGPQGTFTNGLANNQALIWAGTAYAPRQIDTSDLSVTSPIVGTIATTQNVAAGTGISWDAGRAGLSNDNVASNTNFAIRAAYSFRILNGISGPVLMNLDSAGNLTSTAGMTNTAMTTNGATQVVWTGTIATVPKFNLNHDSTNFNLNILVGSLVVRNAGGVGGLIVDQSGNLTTTGSINPAAGLISPLLASAILTPTQYFTMIVNGTTVKVLCA